MSKTTSLRSRPFVFSCASMLMLLAGCPEPEGPIAEGNSDSTGIELSDTGPGDGDGDGGPGDGDGDGNSGDGDGDVGDGDGEPPSIGECGDGVVNLGESCDDGNLESGDGCSAGCSVEGLVLPCGSKIYACGDGIDNDGDGKIDTDDPECISPCDDDEANLGTGIQGDVGGCKSDCFFDGNAGSGNDACVWNLKCDPQNPGAQTNNCAYDPDFAMCQLEVGPDCQDFCEPLVPNGCDCFGCCDIGGDYYYLDSGSGCTVDNLDACESCTFIEECSNPCEPDNCELCFGQDPSELPPECTGTTCPDGEDQSCLSSLDCEEGTFCQTGCCVPIYVP